MRQRLNLSGVLLHVAAIAFRLIMSKSGLTRCHQRETWVCTWAHIDASTTMPTHINHVSSSCFGALRQMSSIENFLPLHALNALFKSLVHSRLDYCNGDSIFRTLSLGLSTPAVSTQRSWLLGLHSVTICGLVATGTSLAANLTACLYVSILSI